MTIAGMGGGGSCIEFESPVGGWMGGSRWRQRIVLRSKSGHGPVCDTLHNMVSRLWGRGRGESVGGGGGTI